MAKATVEPETPVYERHLVRLYAGDYERLRQFYSKPSRAIRRLVKLYLDNCEKGIV